MIILEIRPKLIISEMKSVANSDSIIIDQKPNKLHRVTRQDCHEAGAVMRKTGQSPVHEPRSCKCGRLPLMERSGHWGNLRRRNGSRRRAKARPNA